MPHRLSRLALAAAVAQVVAVGCVQSRPSRNGVFNENQYVRKDFLVEDWGTSGQDPGWMLLGTITAASTPNPLGADMWSLSPGINSGQAVPFRFVITEDTLQMVSTVDISSDAASNPYGTPTVINAWPITNVDLQYQVNLDGETTNFYQENQERPWQQREWVKVQWDKNNMSDLAPMGEYTTNLLSHCVDSSNVSTTLVTNSFITEPAEASASTPVLTDPGASPTDYMEWTVNVTLPLIWDDATCFNSYGYLGVEAARLNKFSETLNLKYSMMRAQPLPADPTDPQPGEDAYQPLVVAEKDAIRHKYGFLDTLVMDRDTSTGQLAANDYVDRFDPDKPIVWYFAPGFNEQFKAYYTAPGGLADQTNALLQKAGVKARVQFLNFDDKTGLDPNLNPNEWANGRQYGDIRYNFLVWLDDGDDVQDTWAGVTELTSDPRDGQTLSANITLSNYAVEDHLVQRVDAFLAQIGASQGVNSSQEWGTPTDANGTPLTSCKNGDVVPVIPADVQNTLYAANTVYQDFQTYLGQPPATAGSLGPSSFIINQDQDFYNAYFKLVGYEIFADPALNAYVTPLGNVGVFGADDVWALAQQEAQFQQEASDIDHGLSPYTQTGTPADVSSELTWLDGFRQLTQEHRQYQYAMHFANNRLGMHMDGTDSLAFENVAGHAARHCINGQWETKEQWEQDLISTYWSQVAFHEFGHAMGLTHNFMGSIDRPEYPALTCSTVADCGTGETCSAAGQCITSNGSPHYTNYTSSVMEYQEAMADVYWTPQWGPYDKGAISWIYANSANQAQAAAIEAEQEAVNGQGQPIDNALSGQLSPTSPWKDPNGFTTDVHGNVNELDIMMCNENDLAYTPLCRQDDLGSTPSEIIANQISAYEWQFAWRNERQYEKFWDDSAYANSPAALFDDMRRFASLWAFDWSSGELADTLRLIGVTNPEPSVTGLDDYYAQLTDKFNAEISAANQMVASYHEAMIQQSAGARPFATTYDPYFGDVTQQGIILDKLFAMEGFAGLWPTDDYDQNQAGAYIAYYEGFGDTTFNDIAQAVVVSMIGGGYDVYPYFVPLAASLFAQDTHDPSFPTGAAGVRNWIGNQTYVRNEDFLANFQQIAETNSYSGPGCTAGGVEVNCSCSPTQPCNYDPTLVSASDPQKLNQFVGPDEKRYIWCQLPSRNNVYVVAERDTHIVTYGLINTYNADINIAMDDGNDPGAAYGDELQIDYTVDAFNQFNDVSTNTSN